MTIQLKVKYSRTPNQEEFDELWNSFIPKIEEMHLYAGWLSDSQLLKCHFDTDYTELSIGEIIDNLSDFLSEKKAYIKTFQFSIRHKLGDPMPGENPQPYLPGCSLE